MVKSGAVIKRFARTNQFAITVQQLKAERGVGCHRGKVVLIGFCDQ
ncbi:hypothetical protein MH1LPH_13820 [Lactiplantibacillus brownii]